MAKRKPKYKVKEQPIKSEIKKRFEQLIKQGKEDIEKSNSVINFPKGDLWRWDTLEDVYFE